MQINSYAAIDGNVHLILKDKVNGDSFLNTTIGPDLMRRPLEDGEGCAKPPSGPPPSGATTISAVEPTYV